MEVSTDPYFINDIPLSKLYDLQLSHTAIEDGNNPIYIANSDFQNFVFNGNFPNSRKFVK